MRGCLTEAGLCQGHESSSTLHQLSVQHTQAPLQHAGLTLQPSALRCGSCALFSYKYPLEKLTFIALPLSFSKKIHNVEMMITTFNNKIQTRLFHTIIRVPVSFCSPENIRHSDLFPLLCKRLHALLAISSA